MNSKAQTCFFSRIRRTHDVPSILVKEWKISKKLWRFWFGTPIFSSVGHGGSKKIIGFPEHITSRSLSGVETSQLENTLVHGRLSSRYTWLYNNNTCPMLTSKLQCHIVFLYAYTFFVWTPIFQFWTTTFLTLSTSVLFIPTQSCHRSVWTQVTSVLWVTLQLPPS